VKQGVIMNRRNLLAVFGAMAAASACPAHAQPYGAQGCQLLGTAADSFRDSVDLVDSCGVTLIDQTFPVERQILVQLFGVDPSFAFFDDRDGPNAFATTEQIAGPSAHGSVCFGTTLLRSELNRTWWGAAVAGIAAHEWAHIKQAERTRRFGLPWGPVVKRELQADYMAGWYLRRKNMAGTPVVLDGLGESLFNKGDFDFNNPDWHGTPQQRVEAMIAGFANGHMFWNADGAYDASAALVGIPG
jgi:hypothetical protein